MTEVVEPVGHDLNPDGVRGDRVLIADLVDKSFVESRGGRYRMLCVERCAGDRCST